jgi:hypothetical protein
MTNEKFSQELTADDAEQIADRFLQFEQALRSYRNDNDELSDTQKTAIKELEQEIHLTAQQKFTEAVGFIIDDAQASLEKIQLATQKATDAVTTIETFKRVIAVAAGVIKIGVSVISRDVGGIVDGIGQVAAQLPLEALLTPEG